MECKRFVEEVMTEDFKKWLIETMEDMKKVWPDKVALATFKNATRLGQPLPRVEAKDIEKFIHEVWGELDNIKLCVIRNNNLKEMRECVKKIGDDEAIFFEGIVNLVKKDWCRDDKGLVIDYLDF
jgi:DNA-binding ferritin-like protein (Dps family)